VALWWTRSEGYEVRGQAGRGLGVKRHTGSNAEACVWMFAAWFAKRADVFGWDVMRAVCWRAHLRLGATLSSAARSAASRLWKNDLREGWNPACDAECGRGARSALPRTSPCRRLALEPKGAMLPDARE
jgi:hypothetical protein